MKQQIQLPLPPGHPARQLLSMIYTLFLCPIKEEVMSDPVIAEDGRTYEQAAIEPWGNLSPVTHELLPSDTLIRNHSRRSAIMEARSITEAMSSAPPGPPAQSLLERVEEMVKAMFICPITQGVMRDPVVAADGHTYERTEILRWFQNHNRSPLTNETLPNTNLIPDVSLRLIIGETRRNGEVDGDGTVAVRDAKVPQPTQTDQSFTDGLYKLGGIQLVDKVLGPVAATMLKNELASRGVEAIEVIPSPADDLVLEAPDFMH